MLFYFFFKLLILLRGSVFSASKRVLVMWKGRTLNTKDRNLVLLTKAIVIILPLLY